MKTPARRLLLTGAIVLAGALASAAPASARDGYVTSFDGTKIVYSFFPAAGLKPGRRAPTIMVGPGYSMSRDTNPDSGSDGGLFGSIGLGPLHHAGYNVLTWDPRGFGDSGGSVEADSPDFEGRDVSALIDRIAQQPEAQLDGPNDPRLGMNGVSYGGGIQLVSAAIDGRIDAITPTIAWNSLVTSLYKNRTVKGGWGAALFGVGTGAAAVNGELGGLQGQPGGFTGPRMQDPHVMDAFVNGAATGTLSPDDENFFATRGPGALVRRIRIPTFLVEGTADTLFTLHESIVNYGILRRGGVPVKMLWFCGGHGVCLTNKGDPSIIQRDVVSWLDRYVKRNVKIHTGPRFEWTSDTGRVRAAGDYPLPPGRPLTGQGAGTLPLVPGDTSGALIAAAPAATAVNVPLARPAVATQLLGEPTLTLTYSGTGAPADDRIYAQLVDDRTHLALGNQVTPIDITLDGKAHTLTMPLEGVAVDAAPASSYTLQIAAGSNVYFAQRSAGAVSLSSVAVSVPTVGAASGTAVRRLALRVAPGRVTAGRRTCFGFRATSARRAVGGASISFAGRRVRTGPRGGARMCTAVHAGRHRARAAKRGYRPAAATVTAVRAAPRPRFTG